MASPEFQETLIDFLPKMRSWAISMTRNKAAAEDLLQDVAVKALLASNSFIPGTNFSAWIHRIMTNEFISGIRARRHIISYYELPEVSISANQQDLIELREVRVGMSRLPSDQRNAIQWIAIEGSSYDEISEKEGMAIGTLKSRVHRARASLREHMDGRRHLAA